MELSASEFYGIVYVLIAIVLGTFAVGFVIQGKQLERARRENRLLRAQRDASSKAD